MPNVNMNASFTKEEKHNATGKLSVDEKKAAKRTLNDFKTTGLKKIQRDLSMIEIYER